MSASSAARFLRQAIRNLPTQQHAIRVTRIPAGKLAISSSFISVPRHSTRAFATSTTVRQGLMPDSPDPAPPHNAPQERATEPTALSDDEYHEISDLSMNAVHEKAELLQESRDDVEVEYSAGVLSITFPPNGTYVINKQPPNKQIWLSSPVSGPKRFDWVVENEGMHEKGGTGVGEWTYLRDGSTLTELLSKELGLSLSPVEESI